MKNILNKLICRDRMRVSATFLSVILILCSILPITLISLYNNLQQVASSEYANLFRKAVMIETKIKESGSLEEINDDYYDGLSFPGEFIRIETGLKEIRDVEIQTPSYADKLSIFENQVLSFAIPLFFNDFKKSSLSSLPSHKKNHYKFFIDEQNRAFATIYHTFEHEDHFDTIVIRREMTRQLSHPFNLYSQNVIFMFVWFFTMTVIGVIVCLKFIFRPLQKAIEGTFNNAISNNYNSRIADPLYGKEISKVVDMFNKILNKMQDLVQSNLNSMQDVSHEVKTYLTTIKQSVDIIKLYGEKDHELAYAKLIAIEEHVMRADKVMSTILQLARLKQGGGTLHANNYDPKYLLNYLLNYKRKVYPDCIFETNYDSDEGHIFIDRDHFFLALKPIIENAVKYSTHSNVIRIDIQNKKNDNLIYIAITNRGVPINPKEIPFLFDRYYRGKNFESTKQGSGLGLTISKEVVELYKGRITVNSKTDGETTFTLAFPKAERKRDLG